MELNKDYILQNSNYYSDLNNVVEEPHTLLEENEVLWNQQNEKYERTETKVTIELYKDNNQTDKILNELKIYLDCHAQECALLFQFYGVSKQPDSDDYFIVKQFTQNSSLANYISQNVNNLDWETKLHLLLYVAEDLKAIHNAGDIHKYLHPFSVLVFDNIGSYDSSFSNSDDGCFCAIGEFSRYMHRRLNFCPRTIHVLGISFGRKILHRDLHSGNIVIHQGEAKIIDFGIAKSTETETHLHSGVMGVITYIDPKRASGKLPFVENESVNHIKLHLIDGLREEPVPDTPEEYLKLYKLC
ncbi:hypothetical protein C1646_667979 [Rhizophagus diaphanus]|nr:hypothetical protein C1646_667979 [Rhizophagus diaphanus] [Rhizophagus sp. MUCL 43196]